MKTIPRQHHETLVMLMKRADLDPRDYPAVHIHWTGCGDSGGIEDINPMTPAGLEVAQKHNQQPAMYHNDGIDYYATHRRTDGNGMGFTCCINLNQHRRGDWELDQWVYEAFDLCEINDGSYAHIFIDMATRKVWGASYNWVMDEVENVVIDHEDRPATS